MQIQESFPKVSPDFPNVCCIFCSYISLYNYLAVHWIPQAKLNDALHNAGTNNKIQLTFWETLEKLWETLLLTM